MHVTNGIPLKCSLLLPVHTVNRVQTLKVLPNVIFYFPVLNQNYTGFGASRYWTMIAAPVADMQGMVPFPL